MIFGHHFDSILNCCFFLNRVFPDAPRLKPDYALPGRTDKNQKNASESDSENSEEDYQKEKEQGPTKQKRRRVVLRRNSHGNRNSGNDSNI